MRVIKGYNREIEPDTLYPDENGIVNIRIRELERVEIYFNTDRLPEGLSVGKRGFAYLPNRIKFSNRHWTGFQIIGNQFQSLPIGSKLDPDNVTFSWTPGTAFVGNYRLVFIETNHQGIQTRKNVSITINPKFSNGEQTR